MSSERDLKEKLRKIEALFAGAATPGEKAAAAAVDRIKARLQETGSREKSVEVRFSLHDPWSRRLFIALCRRYGLRPYRYPRMRQQSVVVNAPATFLDNVLWPEFLQIDEALDLEWRSEIGKLGRDKWHYLFRRFELARLTNRGLVFLNIGLVAFKHLGIAIDGNKSMVCYAIDMFTNEFNSRKL